MIGATILKEAVSTRPPKEKESLVMTDAPDVLLTPDELHKITEETAAKEKKDAREAEAKAEQHRQTAQKAFMERQLRPDAMSYVMAGVRHAAEQGKHEFLVLQFPAEDLSDGGRRVNNMLPDWPASLQGLAKRAYDFYEEKLKPAGFKLHAQVLDYPGGRLGDVGFILAW